MFTSRQNAQICPMVVLVIAVYVIHMTTFKQFPNKGLGNQTMDKERLTTDISRRSVSQTYFDVGKLPTVGGAFLWRKRHDPFRHGDETSGSTTTKTLY